MGRKIKINCAKTGEEFVHIVVQVLMWIFWVIGLIFCCVSAFTYFIHFYLVALEENYKAFCQEIPQNDCSNTIFISTAFILCMTLFLVVFLSLTIKVCCGSRCENETTCPVPKGLFYFPGLLGFIFILICSFSFGFSKYPKLFFYQYPNRDSLIHKVESTCADPSFEVTETCNQQFSDYSKYLKYFKTLDLVHLIVYFVMLGFWIISFITSIIIKFCHCGTEPVENDTLPYQCGKHNRPKKSQNRPKKSQKPSKNVQNPPNIIQYPSSKKQTPSILVHPISKSEQNPQKTSQITSNVDLQGIENMNPISSANESQYSYSYEYYYTYEEDIEEESHL